MTLTQRQCELCVLNLSGWPNKKIAKFYDTSVGTIQVHFNNIYAKVDVSTKVELAVKFLKEEIV